AALWVLLTGLTAWGVRTLPWTAADLGLAALLGTGLASTKISVTPALTQEHLGYLLAEILACHTVAAWARTTRRLRQVAWGLLATGAALGAVGGASALRGGRVALPGGLLQWLPFAIQDTMNKNVLGGTLAVLLPLGCGLWLAQPSLSREGILALLGTGLTGAGLALSQSRGAYLAAGAGLAVMLTLYLWRWVRWAWLAGGLGVAGLAFSGRLAPLLADVLRFDSLGGPEVRLEVWSRALAAIHDFPFTGVGLGSFPVVIPALYPYLDATPGRVIPHAHNVLLQAGVDLGVGGLIGCVAVLLAAAARGITAWRAAERGGARAPALLLLGALGALTAFLVDGIPDAVTWGTKPAFLAWAALGLLCAIDTGAPPAAGRAGPQAALHT
ncbi:MAG TPA: O-antigen ligase family protein, partial [Chloroflexia bacterium]|nr:O-antigen ligase family protein [Chloroflexia bacterium]